jgi:hypothetical protein
MGCACSQGCKTGDCIACVLGKLLCETVAKILVDPSVHHSFLYIRAHRLFAVNGRSLRNLALAVLVCVMHAMSFSCIAVCLKSCLVYAGPQDRGDN